MKIFNWIATLWRGQIMMKTPLYFAAALPALFVIGGISGIMLAVFPVDWQLHDTYFVVAHLHYVLFGGSVFGIFAGLYYWFPKMSGRLLSEGLGKLSFWTMFVGFNLTFLIQHSAGLSGMPRRVYDYPADAGLHGLQPHLHHRLVHARHRRADHRGQRAAQRQARPPRGQRPVEGQHARVVRLSPRRRPTTST